MSDFITRLYNRVTGSANVVDAYVPSMFSEERTMVDAPFSSLKQKKEASLGEHNPEFSNCVITKNSQSETDLSDSTLRVKTDETLIRDTWTRPNPSHDLAENTQNISAPQSTVSVVREPSLMTKEMPPEMTLKPMVEKETAPLSMNQNLSTQGESDNVSRQFKRNTKLRPFVPVKEDQAQNGLIFKTLLKKKRGDQSRATENFPFADSHNTVNKGALKQKNNSDKFASKIKKTRPSHHSFIPLVPVRLDHSQSSAIQEHTAPLLTDQVITKSPFASKPSSQIKVTIGRIDVRAIMQPAPAQPRRQLPKTPKLTLDDFLKERSRRKR